MFKKLKTIQQKAVKHAAKILKKPAQKAASPVAKKATKSNAAKTAAKAKSNISRGPKKIKPPKYHLQHKHQAPKLIEDNIAPPTDHQMWHLIEKGRGRGFLTETEVFQTFPRLEIYLA